MKIQCDVCEKDEASVFCVADEAAICSACDHRVHHANKLAGKHHRFSLHHPSPKQAPLCDICKGKRAFLFCQQDRAILCKDCDHSIHKANEHTQKHTRFLLTGVKLSSISTVYSDSPTQSSAPSVSNNVMSTTSSSTISEYLIETLPGWHVEDFLDCPSPSPLCKKGEISDHEYDHGRLPLWDADYLDSNSNMSGFSNGLWVPQAPPSYHDQTVHENQSVQMMTFGSSSSKEEFGGINYMKVVVSRKRGSEGYNSFAVPQINITPSSNNASKRISRTLW